MTTSGLRRSGAAPSCRPPVRSRLARTVAICRRLSARICTFSECPSMSDEARYSLLFFFPFPHDSDNHDHACLPRFSAAKLLLRCPLSPFPFLLAVTPVLYPLFPPLLSMLCLLYICLCDSYRYPSCLLFLFLFFSRHCIFSFLFLLWIDRDLCVGRLLLPTAGFFFFCLFCTPTREISLHVLFFFIRWEKSSGGVVTMVVVVPDCMVIPSSSFGSLWIPLSFVR